MTAFNRAKTDQPYLNLVTYVLIGVNKLSALNDILPVCYAYMCHDRGSNHFLVHFCVLTVSKTIKDVFLV